ncbi:hypothetical protein AZF37_08870 [endosymbiont 'TC1' of Trimyema compressum]|nr:hypothetical protein AZF37_08870 [endosymbiont 'TC1' of Trimyema compressum]
MPKVNIETLNEKEQLLYKMLNSIDYYETLEATTKHHYIDEMEDRTILTKFSVDKLKKSSLMKDWRNGVDASKTLIQNDECITTFDFDNSYIKSNLFNKVDSFEVPVDDNFIKVLHPNERKYPYTERIGYPFLVSSVQPIINNCDLLNELILKQEEWVIQNQVTYLNRTCFLIKGNLTLYTNSTISQIEILIDKETWFNTKNRIL